MYRPPPKKRPKVLYVDIETAPILGHVWQLFQNDVALNQIQADWFILAWAAKWRDDDVVMYQDQRKAKNVEDDSQLLKDIWRLLNEADIVVGQNSKAFDVKKLNARFIINKMRPPATFKQIDTKLLAQRHFNFTSNKLEYLSDKLCTKYKKLKHTKFPGHEMWKECLAGNIAAWKEMEKYNKHDVLALEELHAKLQPWDSSLNFNLYHDEDTTICPCGSSEFRKNGHAYTSKGKYQRYECVECGAETRGTENEFTPKKRKSLRPGTTR